VAELGINQTPFLLIIVHNPMGGNAYFTDYRWSRSPYNGYLSLGSTLLSLFPLFLMLCGA